MCEECIIRGGVRARLVGNYSREFPESEDGGGHIVFADYNVEDDHIRYCLDQTDVPLDPMDRAFLEFLLLVPYEEIE